jgi:hypothetical protein
MSECATGDSGNLSTSLSNIQNLCGFSTPTAMRQLFIVILYNSIAKKSEICRCKRCFNKRLNGRGVLKYEIMKSYKKEYKMITEICDKGNFY